MKRKIARSSGLLLLLICLTGGVGPDTAGNGSAATSTISFDAGQPKVTAGTPSSLSGTGTYTKGANESLDNYEFSAATQKGAINPSAAGTDQFWSNGKWNSSVNLAKGTYDVTVSIEATDMTTMMTTVVKDVKTGIAVP